MTAKLVEFERQLQAAGVIDQRCGVRGTFVWLPYGMQMRKLFLDAVREVFQAKGFDEYLFPTLVDADEFRHITEHIKDFSARVFSLDERILLRPSAESVIYPLFRKWIRTEANLPVKVFQIGTSFRPGRPRGVFRAIEADPFIEGHTAHATRDDATEQLERNIALVRQVLDFMGLPVIMSDRPLWTNNPVAERIIGFDTHLPLGETLLVASAYAQMQVFSRAFGVRFTSRRNVVDYTYQTAFGFSSRLLFASLMLYADQHGLRILPAIAPYQVVVVPIWSDGNNEPIVSLAQDVMSRLSEAGIRTVLDSTEERAERKFFAYEAKGVPVRVEVGQRELDAGAATVVRRDTRQRTSVPLPVMTDEVARMLSGQQQEWIRAIAHDHDSHLMRIAHDTEIAEVVDSGRVARFALCREESCLRDAERLARGEVLGYQPSDSDVDCLICGHTSRSEALLARHV